MNILPRWRRLVAVVLTGYVCFSFTNDAALAAEGKVRGRVQYEKILYRNPDTGELGLQLDRPVLRPVVGARVELVDEGQNILAAATTDDHGDYILSWSTAAPGTVQVRVLAAADNAVVVDHFEPEKTYSVSSESWPLADGEAVKDVVATDKGRLSGPFNILAVIRLGNELVRSAEPGIAFPSIKVRWTTRPRPGTTYFVPGKNEAVVLGDRADDSDEFDDFVILHEYGHFLSFTFSRDDSPGGYHASGLRLDPRLAWSEGWANFFAAAALNDPLYIDTGVNRFDGSGVRLRLDLDEDRPNGDRSGYWSEHSVGSALWDLYDSRPGKLHVGLGFVEIWKVVRGKAWMERPRYRNLIDFCDELVAARPELGPRVAEVLAARAIGYTPGKSVDDPYVRVLTAGTPVEGELDSTKTAGRNRLEATSVFTFTLTEKTKIKLHLEILDSKVKEKSDLDLWLLGPGGNLIRMSQADNGVGGTETIEIELAPGAYFVEVRSWAILMGGATGHNTGTYRLRVDF